MDWIIDFLAVDSHFSRLSYAGAGKRGTLYHEIENAIEEVNEGKVTYIDPDHLWENIQ